MRLFHSTAPENVAPILHGGFRDATGSYMLANLTLTGVFLSNVPLDENEGAKGGEVLEVDLPDDVDLADFEIVDESGFSGYREWCVPAALINGRGTVRLLTDDEVDEAWTLRHD